MSWFSDPLQDNSAVRRHATHRKVFLQEKARASGDDDKGGGEPSLSSVFATPLVGSGGGGGGGGNSGGGDEHDNSKPRRYESDEVDNYPSKENAGNEGGCLRRFLHETVRHGGIGASMFTLTASTVGAGFLSLPQAFAQCGYVQGSVLLVIFGFLTVYSFRLLGMAERRTGLATFEDLSRHLLGPFWDRVTTFIMLSFNFGAAVAYIIALVKVCAPILEASDAHRDETFAGYWGARLVTIGIWGCLIVPMCLQKELNSIRYFSMFSIFAISYFIFVIVGHAVSDKKTNVETMQQLDPWLMSNEMLVGITLIMFAYACQSNVYEVFSEMSPRSVPALTKSSGISAFLSGVLYLLAGWFGYANFGRAVHGAILDDFHPRRNAAVMIAFICLAVKLCASFVTCIHPTRDSILYTLGWGSYLTVDWKKRCLVTFVLCLLALICGLFIPNITIVFGLMGGLGGSTLGFFFPGAYCIFTGGWTPNQVGWADFIGAWSYVVLGCLTFSLGTVASIYQIAQGD